jgi:hypothetical protein
LGMVPEVAKDIFCPFVHDWDCSKAAINTLTFSFILYCYDLLRSKFLLACFCIRSEAFKTL